jgi:glyoxylate reductase
VLLATIDAPLSAEDIEALPASYRALATYSVGLDHIDVTAATTRGLAIFNTPNALADSVADAAMLLLLGAARRATEALALLRGGRWTGWNANDLNGVELRDKTLGVYGLGEIGLRVAARARAFGMSILYANRRPSDAAGQVEARFVDDPRRLLSESDFVLLAAPSSPETRCFINKANLENARADLILINIARGDLVDDDAVIEALTNGRLRAVGLDVFNGEPRIDSRYFDLPNVFMLPHIGSSTYEARRRMGLTLVRAILDWQGAQMRS